MRSTMDFPRAQWRGEWVKTNARMTARGIPIDTAIYDGLVTHWAEFLDRLKAGVQDYGVHRADGSFNHQAFGAWLTTQGLTWPRTPKGHVWSTEDETWKRMGEMLPSVKRLADVERTLKQLKTPPDFLVGRDGRSRPHLIPFAQKSGRTTAKKFVFAVPAFLRGLVRPAPGWGLANLDFSAEEFGISGVISRDPVVLADYQTGEPDLIPAVIAGDAPPGATKRSHPRLRNGYKLASLAPVYGQRAKGLATRMQKSVPATEQLLEILLRRYPTRERYLQCLICAARLDGWVQTAPSHWRMTLSHKTSDNLLRNFLIQATAVDVLMVAGPLVEAAGVRLLSTYHDSCLIEAPLEDLDAAIDAARTAMVHASQQVLEFPLRVGVQVVRAPDRFVDDREREAIAAGTDLWTKVTTWLRDPVLV